MLDKDTEEYLTSQIGQGGMAIRAFVRKSSVDDVLKLLVRFAEMNQSGNTWEMLQGTLCAYALAVALRDESAAARADSGGV